MDVIIPGGEANHRQLAFTRADIEQAVPARFEQIVRHFPDYTALIGNGQRWLYGDLNRQVNRIAYSIMSATRPGIGCVALLVDHAPEMVIGALAVLKAGKVYVGIHPGMPATAQKEVMRDAMPELILTTRAFEPRAIEIGDGTCAIVRTDQMNGEWPDENPPVITGPSDPGVIFYTSGTTDRPKGVVKSHRAMMHRVWLAAQYDALNRSDRQSLLTYCSFSSSEVDIFGALLHGATLCPFDVASKGLIEFREWIDQEQITILHPPVVIFRQLLATLKDVNMFPSVRLVALAGDVVHHRDVEKWQRHFSNRCVLTHRFSATETSLLAVSHLDRTTMMAPEKPLSGHPVADKYLAIMNENGTVAADGERGELVVSSPYIADGYWRRPDDTAAVFKTDPAVPGQRIYRTGDLGRFLRDGSFAFTGRRDHRVKIRGHRVDTREVESALLQMGEVKEAAIVVQKAKDGDRLLAFVAFNESFQFDPMILRDRLRTRLPEWKIPVRFQSVLSLPLTLTGKVDKQRLEQEISDLSVPDDASTNATGTVEEELAKIWQNILRLRAIGHDDNFLDLGGDSLSMMMTLSRIEHRYGVKISPAEFFQLGTIRQLARSVRSLIPTAEWPTQEPQVDHVSDRYLELLNACGVNFIFINPGTDTAPILESLAKFQAQGRCTPELILCLHEAVAMAASHGYFMVTGRPQVVLVHVDVGTLNIGANLHNAHRDRAGVVICAGRAPDVPGGRTLSVHWMQDRLRQVNTVEGYVKWCYELTRQENLHLAVERAFQIAGTEPAGPVYLTLAPEVLLQPIDNELASTKIGGIIPMPAADPASISKAAEWLIEAENPLILVSYAGRNPKAVASLIKLAETLSIPVIESRHRMNFPSTHPLHLGFSAARYVQNADCVLVVDHDVPWVPAQSSPPAGCRVIHIDIDPLKQSIPLWGFPVGLAIQADSAHAMTALSMEVEQRMGPLDRTRVESRRRVVMAEHDSQRAMWVDRALELAPQQPIAPEWAALCLSEIVDEDTVIVCEAVTNAPIIWKYVTLDKPGTFFENPGSGLGWGLGAALGAKLAMPSKTIICAVGDGSWVFGSPIAAYQAAEKYRSPFLTVIFNNQAYAATTDAILAIAPDGYARRSGNYPACDLPKEPIYAKLAEAMGLWARTVKEPEKLSSVLRESLEVVRGGRSALVDISVASPRPPAEN